MKKNLGARKFSISLAYLIVLAILISTISGEPIFVNAAENGNVIYPGGVTADMTNASYWQKLAVESNKVLLSAEEIKSLNDSIADNSKKKVRTKLHWVKNVIPNGKSDL